MPLHNPHIHEHCPFRLQTKLHHAIFYTLQVFLPLSLLFTPITSIFLYGPNTQSSQLPKCQSHLKLPCLTTLALNTKKTVHVTCTCYMYLTLDTGHKNPFMWFDAPWADRIGNSSLNFFELSLITLHPSSSCLIHPSSCTKCVTQNLYI